MITISVVEIVNQIENAPYVTYKYNQNEKSINDIIKQVETSTNDVRLNAIIEFFYFVYF